MVKKSAPKKLEIFLLLALRQTNGVSEENSFSFANQLLKSEAESFERLRMKYQNLQDDEKQKWLNDIQTSIGEDFLIDDNIHRSHIDAILNGESPTVQKIIRASLPAVYQLGTPPKNIAENLNEATKSKYSSAIEKIVRQSFAGQFVALTDLPEIRSFDRLTGAQLARLVRLAGIREVAFACARIESVESLGAFLRRFEPEDARAIAAQLSNLPRIADERVAFAENLVQSALEIEPQPTSAMLDWLGIRLIGITLCAQEETNLQIAYAEQKLPLGTVPTLSEIIETQCRQTPEALKRKISAEVEELSGML